MYRTPRGVVDILPEEQSWWRYVEQKAAVICQLYGYQRIDNPVFEDAGLFVRSVGEATDIVQKEMYTFEDRSGSKLTLRPEGTASVCRAYMEHGMHNLPQPVKLYYLTPIFRYERPQAGRYRQHHQFGYEAIGDGDPALDAETIDMAWQFCLSLGLGSLTLQLNSIGCKQCRPAYLNAVRDYYATRGGGLCSDCNSRLQRNPLRLLDCKQPTCQPVAESAPKSVDYLCPDCVGHFNQLKKNLELLSMPYIVNHRLVRGLDYYTRTVFEIQPETEGSQSTLGGGGRYDDLIEELGGKHTPAIGFATGMERIILNLKRQKVVPPPLPGPQVFVASADEKLRDEVMKLTASLRREGTGAILSYSNKSLKAQLRLANTLGVRYAIIIGEQEIQSGTAVLRDMATAEQKTVARGELARLLRSEGTCLQEDR